METHHPAQIMKTESTPVNETETQPEPSLIVSLMGTDGGLSKTHTANLLSDFYDENGIEIARIDCDVDKSQMGSFSYFHRDANKVDIRTLGEADAFIKIVQQTKSKIALVDQAANLAKFSLDWYDEMYESMHEANIRLVFVGVVTSSPASVQAILRWAAKLGPRGKYILFTNEKDGNDFSYLYESPQGKQFLEMAKPPIILVKKQLPKIQAQLDNLGLTLRQALHAPNEKLGPELHDIASKMRIRGRFKDVFTQLMAVKQELLP
jgi:hypothetical protein